MDFLFFGENLVLRFCGQERLKWVQNKVFKVKVAYKLKIDLNKFPKTTQNKPKMNFVRFCQKIMGETFLVFCMKLLWHKDLKLM